MKVSKLIELLQAEDPEAEVHFAYNYGDYWRTIVAPKVCCVEESRVIHSNYHDMPRIVGDDDDHYNFGDAVVVLSADLV